MKKTEIVYEDGKAAQLGVIAEHLHEIIVSLRVIAFLTGGIFGFALGAALK